MGNNKLVEYIKKQLESGYSKDKIKKALLEAGWDKRDVEVSFNSIINDTEKTTGLFGRKKVMTIAIFSFLILASLVFGGFYIFSQQEDVPEEKRTTEINDEESEEEISFSEADQCQPGEFDIDFELHKEQLSFPFTGEISFHGMNSGYCEISYSLDISEKDKVMDYFESKEEMSRFFNPHFIGGENFCFLPEEDFKRFHKEIKEGVVTSDKCFLTSIQSEDSFNQVREVINNFSDDNYFGEIEWVQTVIFSFIKKYNIEKIEFMGSSGKKCFYKTRICDSETLWVPAFDEGYTEEDLMKFGEYGFGYYPSYYCIAPCKEVIDELLKTRNPYSLGSSIQLNNPDKLSYSEMVTTETGNRTTVDYTTVLINENPCVYTYEEVILELDPSINSEQDIFKALLSHEEAFEREE